MLPGKLTPKHIEMARERGDNYITYKRRTYSLEELEAMVENGQDLREHKRLPTRNAKSGSVARRKSPAGDADVASDGDKRSEVEPHVEKEPITSGSGEAQ